jgi:hypothetical protein
MTITLEKRAMQWTIWGAAATLIAVVLSLYIFANGRIEEGAKTQQSSDDRIRALEGERAVLTADHDSIVSMEVKIESLSSTLRDQHTEEMKAIGDLYNIVMQHIAQYKTSASGNALTNSTNMVQIHDTGRSDNQHASSVE